MFLASLSKFNKNQCHFPLQKVIVFWLPKLIEKSRRQFYLQRFWAPAQDEKSVGFGSQMTETFLYKKIGQRFWMLTQHPKSLADLFVKKNLRHLAPKTH